MKMFKFRNHEEPRAVRNIPEVPMVIIEDEPAGNIYRELLSDPAFRHMDYRRSCPFGEREECMQLDLLIAKRQQYKQDFPEIYKQGISGPDAQQFRVTNEFCMSCLMKRPRKVSRAQRRKLMNQTSTMVTCIPAAPAAEAIGAPRSFEQLRAVDAEALAPKVPLTEPFPNDVLLIEDPPVDDRLKPDLSSPSEESGRTSRGNEAQIPPAKAVQLPKSESPAGASNTKPFWVFQSPEERKASIVAQGATDALKVSSKVPVDRHIVAEDIPIELVDDHSPVNAPAEAPQAVMRCEKCDPPRDVAAEKWQGHQNWHKGLENKKARKKTKS